MIYVKVWLDLYFRWQNLHSIRIKNDMFVLDDYFKHFKRSAGVKNQGESFNLDQLNGSMNRAGSSPGLSVNMHKQPIARSSSADQPNHPLIVLQKAPPISYSENSLNSKRIIHDHKHRNQKFLKGHKSEDDATALACNPVNMEQIIIHNLPRAPNSRAKRGVLRREDTVTSTASSISVNDDPTTPLT